MFGELGAWQQQVRWDGEGQCARPSTDCLPPLPLDWAAPAWLWVGMMYPALQSGSEGSGAQLAAQMGHLVQIFKITPKATDSQHRSLHWDH